MTFLNTVYAADGVDISGLYNPASNIKNFTLGGLLTGGPVNIINLLFIFVGLFFFVNLIMAGWDYMLSTGDPKKIQGATTRIMNAFVGLIMALTAFIVVQLVTGTLGIAGPTG